MDTVYLEFDFAALKHAMEFNFPFFLPRDSEDFMNSRAKLDLKQQRIESYIGKDGFSRFQEDVDIIGPICMTKYISEYETNAFSRQAAAKIVSSIAVYGMTSTELIHEILFDQVL